ncbi:MAG: hypothetical protein ACFCVA_00580 [Gammaproteobacteria bacterium]
MSNGGIDFKAGGDASAAAAGTQANFDSSAFVNAGEGLGVANPNIQSDSDITRQAQNVGAGALGGGGGADNVFQNITV